MSPSDAAAYGWSAVVPMVKFVMFMGVVMLGFALLREINS